MALREYLKKSHILLSNDLKEALNCSPGDTGYIKVLFLTQLASIGALFITEDSTAHLILTYLLIPLLFLPFKFEEKNFGPFIIPTPVKISFYNIFRNTILCRTPLFLAVIVYGANKAFLSYLYPEPVLGYLHIFFYYLLAPLMAFIIATIRLSVDSQNFSYSFFSIIAPITGLNALANFYLFLKKIPAFSSLGSYRFQSSFGAAMGYNANLDALIHSVFLVGLVITVIQKKPNFHWVLSITTIFILFCSITLEQSRGCLLAVIITLGFYAISSKSITTGRVIFGAAIGIGLIGVYIFVLLPDGINTYLSRPNYLRPEIWFKFYNIIKQNAFIGLGDRTIFSLLLSNGEIAPHPHNLLISSLVRGGIIGLLSMLFIIGFGLFRSYQYAKSTRNAVPFCVFLTVVIAGIFDFDLKIWQAGWYLAGYWLAIALALGSDVALRNEECNGSKI